MKSEREVVMTRVPEEWTEEQLCRWEKISKDYNKVPINGITNSRSMIEDAGMLFRNETTINAKLARDLYEGYIYSVENMMNVYEHRYLNANDKNLVDVKGGISFTNFPFTMESLKEDLLNRGMYEPMFAYVKRQPGNIVVCSGRHRLVSMQSLFENEWKNKEVLCLFLDSRKDFFNCELIVPTLLLDMFFSELKYEKLDNAFSVIETSNPVDLWMIYKVLEKEMNSLVEKHGEYLITAGVESSGLIVREVYNERA